MLQALRAAKVRGVRPAVVVDNKDGADNPGYRLKLAFPWLSEGETTFWARIAVPMAGPGRGTYALPEIGDQVLVVFEHGDIDRPIVIGGIWSRSQEPVEVNQSGNNNTKLIKSRSGHRLIFDDRAGAERVVIVDRTGKNKILLDSAARQIRIESAGEVEVVAKRDALFHANALRIGASDGVTGKARSVLCHAQSRFGLKAASGIQIGGGSTTINESNAAAAQVTGRGSGELGGAAVEQPREQISEQRSPDRPAGAGAVAAGRGTGEPASVASAAQRPPPATRLSFVELHLVDSDGKPVAFARYQVAGSDGATLSGRLDRDGFARVLGVPEGTCQVTFPDFHGEEWSPA